MDYLLENARLAATELRTSSHEKRNQVIWEMRAQLLSSIDQLMELNKTDIDLVRDKPFSLISRMLLNENRIEALGQQLSDVASMDDPIGKITYANEMRDNLKLYRTTVPIGIVLAIYEARPEVGFQIASLAIKTGNAVILKGGKECNITNKYIEVLIKNALRVCGLNENCIQFVYDRETINKLLKEDRHIGLVIPRGGKSLITHVKKEALMPVLSHADGICSIFVEQTAAIDKAIAVILDSKLDYPAACNAVEQLLLDRKLDRANVKLIIEALRAAKVEIRAIDSDLIDLGCQAGTEEDLVTEFLGPTIGVRYVSDSKEAIDITNTKFSHHTDSILTESSIKSKEYEAHVLSSCVFVNSSTRFSDGYRFGFGAEVGIATGFSPPRGPVGLDALVSYKYRLKGDYHTVDSKGNQKYKHRKIEPTFTLPSDFEGSDDSTVKETLK